MKDESISFSNDVTGRPRVTLEKVFFEAILDLQLLHVRWWHGLQ